MLQRLNVRVTGIVQGVGFRPFIYQLATRFGLTGWVLNNPGGVELEVQGQPDNLQQFQTAMVEQTPPLARVDSVEAVSRDVVEGESGFTIRHSDSAGNATVVVPPDVAVCAECLNELFDPTNRRYRYPFINCTHCGPRYSIIRALPYDRPDTTMASFEQCPECLAEYQSPMNRRFHAQPNACARCGPQLSWQHSEQRDVGDDPLQAAIACISDGGIVAVKGLSGVHIVADATNTGAIVRLRTRKHRPAKPLAIMAPSLAWVEGHCHVDDIERDCLISPEAPIVLLDVKQQGQVAPAIAPDLTRWGVMLPYTPLHHLLMAELDRPIVATSGNLSGEPMVIADNEIVERLSSIVDGFLLHNRPIHRPVDDSVLQVVVGDVQLLRMGRGFSPWVMNIEGAQTPTLAVGGHLKNAIALAGHGQIIAGQFLGDLDTERSLSLFQQQCQDLPSFYQLAPERMLADAHPDYASRRWADQQNLPVHTVPHHQAHVAAVMLEHSLQLPLMGLAWDGVGYGEDGTAWGAETFHVTEQGWQRIASIRPISLIGGDKAAKAPKRIAYALLSDALGGVPTAWREALNVSDVEHQAWQQIIDKSPTASSMGRLFDGVSALLGLCLNSEYEGHAAMLLQNAAEQSDQRGAFTLQLHKADVTRWDWRPMINELVNAISNGEPTADLARQFHNTLAAWVAIQASRWIEKTWVLSGGAFQNRLLLRLVNEALVASGGNAYWPKHLPCNDGSIAVGQIAWMQLR